MTARQFLIIGYALLLASCQTNERNSAVNIQGAPLLLKIDSIQYLKRILHGNWYQPEYIANLKATFSPFKSQNTLGSIVEVTIDTTKILGDSLEVGAPSIHEGDIFMAFFRPGLGFSIPVVHLTDRENENNYRLTFDLKNADTLLILAKFDRQGQAIDQQQFLRAHSGQGSALQYMVNKTLFSGRYSATDSIGRPLTLNFDNDGSVTGFPSHSQFYVLMDFIAGPENNLDQVCFDIQTNKQRCFAYSISGDTIRLFDTKENDEHLALSIGDLKYTLTRLRK